jgi:hypothetical protein
MLPKWNPQNGTKHQAPIIQTIFFLRYFPVVCLLQHTCAPPVLLERTKCKSLLTQHVETT